MPISTFRPASVPSRRPNCLNPGVHQLEGVEPGVFPQHQPAQGVQQRVGLPIPGQVLGHKLRHLVHLLPDVRPLQQLESNESASMAPLPVFGIRCGGMLRNLSK